MSWEIRQGDWIEVLRTLPAESVQCVVTSPPYFGLRNYGVDGQVGLESSLSGYIEKLVIGFREVRRVMRSDGVLWCNMGDSYTSGGRETYRSGASDNKGQLVQNDMPRPVTPAGMKPKDLMGVPWSLAFALRADGWYLRQDIIWCLSGGTWLYARTQKGDMPIMVRDLARLRPETVQLWNGEKWTRVRGWSKSKRRGDELELVLRSGERISCTPTHQWPSVRGLLRASDLRAGDVLDFVDLPEPDAPLDTATVDADVAWFVGLYIAEGSRSGDTIQVAGHSKEVTRLERLQRLAKEWGGSVTCDTDGNNQSIRVYGKLLNAAIDQFVSGKTAKDKCLAPVCWRYSNVWLRALLDGYLSGDGAWDGSNKRWRLGLCRNYNLERDLRTMAARLGLRLVLKPTHVIYRGTKRAAFRGEVRFEWGGHHNCKPTSEIVEIRKARGREVYDIGVEDEPHVYALASGIITHNSKPNPMPESVTDRCTKSHEYIFLLSKSERYFYDQSAILEPVSASTHARLSQDVQAQIGSDRVPGKTNGNMKAVGRTSWHGSEFHTGKTAEHQLGRSQKNRKLAEPGSGIKNNSSFDEAMAIMPELRNKRSVWNITTRGYSDAHFATFPPEIPEICIRAGSRECDTILDPFNGAGTTGLVATRLGRSYIGIELNPAYCEMARRRITNDAPLFNTTFGK